MEKHPSLYLENVFHENGIKNKISFELFDNNSVIIITLNFIIILLKAIIINKKGKRKSYIKESLYRDNADFNNKYELGISNILYKLKLKHYNYKIKEEQIKKRKNNIHDKNKIIRNLMFNIIIKSIIMNIFYQIKCNISFDLFNYCLSNITLKIKGIGIKDIVGNNSQYNFKGFNNLKDIYINGKKQDSIEYKYQFNQTENFVELILDDNINNCAYMFYGCSDITEINFYDFNALEVTNMAAMFCGCSSLTSLDLSSFNTSKVNNMCWMFANCLLLTSLDLSNFDTSQVISIDNMFKSCKK